ncbi:YciI family protein [Loktanella sp. DJP18]|uniref:YciI family protein n=1 Tax=Loktanella sp. DJP18 TaxID=3409788 RepID=UPI003BB73EE4
MHYVIHCLDHDGAVDKRLAHYEAHKAYLAAATVRTLVSGPLLADDEETMIGSCFLLEADSLAEVEAFNQNDPFHHAGLWKTVSIRPFAKRVDNR